MEDAKQFCFKVMHVASPYPQWKRGGLSYIASYCVIHNTEKNLHTISVLCAEFVSTFDFQFEPAAHAFT